MLTIWQNLYKIHISYHKSPHVYRPWCTQELYSSISRAPRCVRGARTNHIRLHLVVSAFEDVGCVLAARSLPVLLRADACSTTARSKPRAGRATKVAWSLRVPSGNNCGSTAEGNGNTTGAGHFSLEVPQSPRAGPHAANTRSRMANREQPLARRCFALPGNDATGLGGA